MYHYYYMKICDATMKKQKDIAKKVSTRQPSSPHRHRNMTTPVTSSENRATSMKIYFCCPHY